MPVRRVFHFAADLRMPLKIYLFCKFLSEALKRGGLFLDRED